MTDREAMKMALDALIASHPIANTDKSLDKHSETMSALRQALAQPEQEPVAWLWLHQGEPVNALMFNPSDKDEHFKKKGFSSKPLYTAPPKREWVGLTDEDTANICMQSDLNNWLDEQVIDAVEAKLKEKNDV